MADTEDSVSNDLWNTSVCRKSWVDIVDSELGNCETKENPSTRLKSPNKANSFKLPAVKEDEQFVDEEANLGTSGGQTVLPKVESLPTFGKNFSNGAKTPVKVQPDLPQEDISLTGHLDVKLGLTSPVKPVGNCETSTRSGRRVFTVKSTAPRSSPSKVSKRKADISNGLDDEISNPSPSKVLRSTPKKESEEYASPAPKTMITRKRVRDMLTPTPKRDGKRREKRDQETDPGTLSRRQRQIDFGKNTLGYERYRQMVPKEDREKIHPKTPPIGIKFSRRAWDGLVRVWRQRLHFWDPPSEGGGNPECLEVQSDFSDCSSMDGSQPNTPVQDMKRKRSGRFVRTASTKLAASSAADDDDGCTPLLD